jgi:hypothetical protein
LPARCSTRIRQRYSSSASDDGLACHIYETGVEGEVDQLLCGLLDEGGRLGDVLVSVGPVVADGVERRALHQLECFAEQLDAFGRWCGTCASDQAPHDGYIGGDAGGHPQRSPSGSVCSGEHRYPVGQVAQRFPGTPDHVPHGLGLDGLAAPQGVLDRARRDGTLLAGEVHGQDQLAPSEAGTIRHSRRSQHVHQQ